MAGTHHETIKKQHVVLCGHEATVEIWVTLMNFLYSCLRWGTLLMPYGYAVFGGLKGVSGRGEEAQDRAGGPH